MNGTTARTLEELQEEIDFIETQTSLLNAEKALADARNSAANAGLEKMTAALGSVSLPDGKEGRIAVTAGEEGTTLLRDKPAMLKLISDFAGELARKLEEGAVLVTQPQLENAAMADFAIRSIGTASASLNSIFSALPKASPPVSVPRLTVDNMALTRMNNLTPSFFYNALGGVSGGIAAAGNLLKTAHGVSRLFRSDRTVTVSPADTEAAELLGYFLEMKKPDIIVNPEAMLGKSTATEDDIARQIDSLLVLSHRGRDTLTALKEKPDTVPEFRDDPEKTAELRAAVEGAEAILDKFHPARDRDGFWELVRGYLLISVMKDRPAVTVRVKARVIRVTEDRVWFSNRIYTAGELQAAYAIVKSDGTSGGVGVIVRASAAEKSDYKKLPAVRFP